MSIPTTIIARLRPIYDRLLFHLLSRYGHVLSGLGLLDGRYLFAALLANLFGIISIFFNIVTFGVTEPFLAAAMIVSGWFTVGGFMKKGSLNSTTAEGLLLGNFPIWTFGFWSIPLSLDDYYRNLSICQVEQLLGLSLAFALAVTLASLLTLRRLSAKN